MSCRRPTSKVVCFIAVSTTWCEPFQTRFPAWLLLLMLYTAMLAASVVAGVCWCVGVPFYNQSRSWQWIFFPKTLPMLPMWWSFFSLFLFWCGLAAVADRRQHRRRRCVDEEEHCCCYNPMSSLLPDFLRAYIFFCCRLLLSDWCCQHFTILGTNLRLPINSLYNCYGWWDCS